ncbi:S8 family peptidase [Burkholderia glumae]|uniref:S8 family peptidase n=2 Tax=Burkholderia glumae TaxID=337 RepID=A0AAP9Y3Q4_BURGL|nr:S8 family peptidase [Burkholderia glumae]ACR28799.1 Serine metalloprotease [Burkholderia glumae BGR1]AJY66323.1 subtilase family protein [Burkholderia glumae LMG 2196 = ATCC 33617]MCM2483326.1 S8 family peptidase [Burkholderia glumae]MCM2506643.1 S8 family peptidase [Burkholderia glumae]MCM2538315.1 S8 family peptidase [Burkholderia glumae]
MKKSVRTTSHLKLASFLLAACASFAQAQTPSPSTPATGAASENINQLIVKLKPAAAAARGSTSITTAAADIHGVIDRVLAARRARATTRAFGAAAASAPGNAGDPAANISVKREMADGATVLRLQRSLPAADAAALANDFAADAAVEYAEPDAHMHALLVPNDTRYGEQWGYASGIGGANLPKAWDITTGSANVVVAVVDTGYRPHSDLAANVLPGYDFISDPNSANDGNGRDSDATDPGDWVSQSEVDDPDGPFYRCQVDQYGRTFASDSSWHGTHVAGTIGAVSNNGRGVAGISWKGKILPVRVLGKCGGALSDIADGMRWAAGLSVPGVPANRTPARVLNFSLGGGGSCSRTYQSAINAVVAAGATVVVAAGNEAAQVSTSQPANCQNVIAVAATDVNGRRASFSNYGSAVKIAAPGVNILSTLNSGKTSPAADSYASYNGTSMATPHVAGTVALMLAANGSLTPAQVLQKLQASARPFPSGSGCSTSTCGAGLLDAGAAVSAARQ